MTPQRDLLQQKVFWVKFGGELNSDMCDEM